MRKIGRNKYDDLNFLLKEQLAWSNELYKILTRHLVRKIFSDNYDWEQVSSAIILLNATKSLIVSSFVLHNPAERQIFHYQTRICPS